MLFEISVMVLSITFVLILRKLDKAIYQKYATTFVAVLLFEYFTQALWLNLNLEPWAYLYLDVSWIITLGWTTIIIVCSSLVDLYFPKISERIRFLYYLVFVTVVGIIAEGVVLALGIRAYPEAVQTILSGLTIGRVPLEALYYIPVFMALVISFSRYWHINFHTVSEKKVKPKKRKK